MKYREKSIKRKSFLMTKCLTVALLAVVFSLSVVCLYGEERSDCVMATEGDDGGLSEHVIHTVSPSHVTFNLFDYWLTDRDESSPTGATYRQSGINQGHSYIFGGGAGAGSWNVWTGNPSHYNTSTNTPGVRYGEYQGVVEELLTDGYPMLSLLDDFEDPQKGNPAFIANNGLNATLGESLAYLFDPDISNDYKAVYENVQGLVKYDGNGGYVYNSHENYAAFQESGSGVLGTNGEPSDGHFDVYDSWALTSGGSPNGQFFPFDGAEEVFLTNNGTYETDSEGRLVPDENVRLDGNTTLNHYIGLTMETVFLQPEDGKIDQNTPMSFTFSGDDDVWIFIDNVLVSDLGGIHDECFTIIDFSTGNVYTGLTPMVNNNDGTFSEDIPTLEELRSAEAGESAETQWIWCNRAADRKPNVEGTYEEFKDAHGIQSTTLKEIFVSAGLEDSQAWGDESGMPAGTFDQNTQHELKMFYLERGAGASNLVLSFNMLAVPASGVTKTDQDGYPVSGVEFELWPAQLSITEKDEYGYAAPLIDEETGLYIADTSAGTPICTATTDENGHLNFITQNRKIISFQERAQNDPPQLYYVLKETGRPAGYRSKGDISLYYSIYNDETREGVLLSYNYWQTGAYTQAMLDVTMTDELYEYSLDSEGNPVARDRIEPNNSATEEEIQEYLDNGIVFAVPIKRMDMTGSLYDDSNFHALYGTTNTGWTLMTSDISDKSSVLEAAKNMTRVMQESRQTGTIVAERNARQLFQVTITNIPGDVKLTYPYLLGTDRENESQYNIAFYFAPNAETLDDITNPDSIVRISTVTPEGDRFERQYASQFYVPNTFNRVRVQKMNYYGQRLADAEFTMYQTYSYQQRDGYVWDESKGLYRNPNVVDENGTLQTRETILKSKEWDQGTTRKEGATGVGGLDLDGSLIFPTKFDDYTYGDQTEGYRVNANDTSTFMEEGEYVIFETGAPEGYEANENPITVTVNDDGVFADAGTVNDGIRAGQYAGYILNSITHFAAESAVDETLTFINTKLQVIGEDGQLTSPIEGDLTWMNKYSNENRRYIFFAKDVGRYVTSGRNLYQYTDEGTPQLIITKNNNVRAQVIILDGDYAGYDGTVTVNKKNTDGSVSSLEEIVTDGTMGFWLEKETTDGGKQQLDSLYVGGEKLTEGNDYHVYTPNVTDLKDYEDLSGIFSVETLVQVYDQGYGSLSVTKKTENTPDGSAAKDEIFHFRVYSVFENATKLILAKTDENGEIEVDSSTGQPVTVDFNGTLNVRLRQTANEGQTHQDTATNIAVDFVNGEGMLYLQPDYDVEFVYIPENRNHEIYQALSGNDGIVGLVETRITLTDEKNGSGTVYSRHVAFKDQTRTHDITFEKGVGTFYRSPDYEIMSVTFEGDDVYTVDAADGKKGLTAENRIQYTTLGNILNVPVNGEVDVTFTENGNPSDSNRVIVNDALPPENNDFSSVNVGDGDVTVYKDGDDYKIAYSLSSNTYEDASVAQFALYSGQTINITGFPAGGTYYIYEYAVGDGSRNLNDWDTKIEGGEAIETYRAAKGTIALNDTVNSEQSVIFTNSAHVGQLTISKTLTGDQATDDDIAKAFSFTITLKDKNGNSLRGTYSYTGGGIEDGTLTPDQNGSVTVQLKHGQSITIGELPDGVTYEVQETNGEGYTVVVDGDTDADSIAEGTIQKDQTAEAKFTNIKQSELVFIKVAAEDKTKPLSGAEFWLFRLQCTDENHDHSQTLIDPNQPGDCWTKINTRTSNDSGSIAFPNLEINSEYRLVETKAPDGYALPEGQWSVVTNDQNTIEIKAVGGKDGRIPTAFAVDQNTGGLLLPNAKPLDIPSSGGYGVLPFLLVGMLLMLVAVGIVLARRWRRNHMA